MQKIDWHADVDAQVSWAPLPYFLKSMHAVDTIEKRHIQALLFYHLCIFTPWVDWDCWKTNTFLRIWSECVLWCHDDGRKWGNGEWCTQTLCPPHTIGFQCGSRCAIVCWHGKLEEKKPPEVLVHAFDSLPKKIGVIVAVKYDYWIVHSTDLRDQAC